MSYPAKKGMYRDKNDVYRFERPGLDQVSQTKRWYKGEVVRRLLDSKGEVKRKNKQEAEVYAEEADVAGMLFRRCPDPGMGDGDIRVNVYFQPL